MIREEQKEAHRELSARIDADFQNKQKYHMVGLTRSGFMQEIGLS